MTRAERRRVQKEREGAIAIVREQMVHELERTRAEHQRAKADATLYATALRELVRDVLSHVATAFRNPNSPDGADLVASVERAQRRIYVSDCDKAPVAPSTNA